MTKTPLLTLACMLCCLLVSGAERASKRPVVNEYPWLDNSPDPRGRDWTDARNRQARAVLDKLPTRPWVEDRLKPLLLEPATNYHSLSWRRGRFFLVKSQSPSERSVLVTLGSITNLNSERIILDPSYGHSDNSTTIRWYVPSLDGTFVAACLSENGSGDGTLYIYETATGQRQSDAVPHVCRSDARGSAVWNADGSGIFYTRYPLRGEQPTGEVSSDQQIYFHKLGTSAEQDAYELGKEFPSGDQIELQSSPDGSRILASIADDNRPRFAHFLREPSGRWRQITRFEDKIIRAEFGRDPLYIEAGKDNALYLLSYENAPKGKVLRLPLAKPQLANATLILPEGTNAIANLKPTASGLAVVFLDGGSSDFAFIDLMDKSIRRPGDRTSSTIQEIAIVQADEVLYRDESYTEPYLWWHYNPSRDRERSEATPLAGKSAADFGDLEVVHEMALSRIGTKVPLNIVRKKGTRLRGDNPVILTGDGNIFGPKFDVSRRVWFDQGGVFAMANLRGGGESSADRQRAGSLMNDPPRFDEFAACAEFLVRSNYTKASKLAVQDVGTGGLVMGELLTQGADVVQAVVSQFGGYGMLRAAATASKPPVLFRTRSGPSPSPGIALNKRIQEVADFYAFLFDKLGIDYSQVDRGPWSGSITPTSAVVKAKLAREGMKARLVVSKNPLLARRSYSEYQISATNNYNIVEFSLRDLEPDTQYYYALDLDGRLERIKRGEFRTFPVPGPATFQIAFASCARTGSASDVFDRIRELRPLFYMNMGDFHYLDIQTNSLSRFRAAYDSVLASPQQSDLYRHVPFVYMWDDHDFGGNNSDRRGSHDAARRAYTDLVPHYPLPFEASGPICQSFAVGRVKFILTDLRSARDAVTNRDDTAKSMMGLEQKEWFKRELLEANGRFPLICWVSSVPWIGLAGTNVYRAVRTNEFGYIHHTSLLNRTNETSGSRTNAGGRFGGRRGGPRTDEDHWSVFATERREIADFIKSNHISGVCILHGDSHMLAADDGSNSDYATGGGAPIPVMCAAPLDQEPSLKGGPYSQGVYRVRKGEGAFGLLTVDDRGNHIDVYYSGRNNQNEQKITLNFTVPAANGNFRPNLAEQSDGTRTTSDRRRLRSGL